MSENGQLGTAFRLADIASRFRRIARAVATYLLLLFGVGLAIAGAGELAHLMGFNGPQRQFIRILMLFAYGAVFLGLKKRR